MFGIRNDYYSGRSCAKFFIIFQSFCYPYLKVILLFRRLEVVRWDLRQALKMFLADHKADKISSDKFINDDEDFSDLSSLDDEID